MNIREILENEKLNIEKSIAKEETLLADMPNGILQVHKSGNFYNWFYIDENSESNAKSDSKSKINPKIKPHRHYISKEDRQLAEQLAYKGYLETQLRENQDNLKAINFFLKKYSGDAKSAHYITSNEGRRELLNPKLHDSDKEIEKWLRDKYTGDVPNPSNLRCLSQAGFYVRSKSEQIIVGLLLKYHIPFKYEHPMYINNHNLFPDFTIMHPKTHKIYVWEHLGMMDSYQYRSHNFDKINDYYLLGFVPGDNLILTYETNNSVIDAVLAENLVRHYFL